MYGAILLNEYNEILHTFGNAKFYHKLSISNDSSLNEQENLLSSSTSGVSSSSIDSLESIEENKNNNQNNKNDSKNYKRTRFPNLKIQKNLEKNEILSIDQNTLLHKILPLILMYRTKQEQNNNFYDQKNNKLESLESINDENIKFTLMDYEFSYLLMFITNISNPESIVSMFDQTVLQCINYHYGPYIHLIQNKISDISVMIKSRIKRRMNKLVKNFDRLPLYREVFNINLMYGNANQIQNLMPVFKEIVIKTSHALNKNCRCIFVNSGQILASLCSDEKSLPLFEAFPADEIASLLEFSLLPSDGFSLKVLDLKTIDNADSLKRCLKCQVEQAWLYSNVLGRRQFVNIHVFSLTGEIELICLTNAHFSQLITPISDCLKIFDTKIAPDFRRTSNLRANTKKTFCQKFLLQNNLYNQKTTDSLSDTDESIVMVSDNQLSYKKIILQTNKLLEKIDLLFENFTVFDSTNQILTSQQNIKTNDDFTKRFIYLGNINRTKKLIKSLWKRFHDELFKFYEQDEGYQRRDSNYTNYYAIPSINFSLFRLGSSQSLISHNSSIPSEAVYSTIHSGTTNETGFRSNCTTRFNQTVLTLGKKIRSRLSVAENYNSKYMRPQRVTSAHLDAMLSQLRKVMCALLDEIVTYSNNIAKNEQLNKLHSVIQKIVDQRITKLLNEILNSVVNTWREGNPLRPLNLELNMLAYWFDRSDAPFNYYYIPETFKTIFSNIGKFQMNNDLTVARMENGNIFIQILISQTNNFSTEKEKFSFNKLREGLSRALPIKYTKEKKTALCITIFPGYINISLAIHQTYKLITILNKQINKMQKYFC